MTTEQRDPLDYLEELYAQRDLLALDKEKARQSVIPDAVRENLAAIDAEFGPREATISERIADYEMQVKAIALSRGVTYQGARFHVVYNPGGKQVTAKDLLALATRWDKVNPEVAAEMRSIVTVKKPSASIQARRTE